MALSNEAQFVIDELNISIRNLLVERDRIIGMFDRLLPGPTAVWSYLPTDIQLQLRQSITSNLTTANDRIAGAITAFGSVEGSPM